MDSSRQNVLLVTVDALRADHLGCYGYPRKTSPFIDSLASRGALFSQAITNGGGTPAAFPSILASVFPPLHLSQYKTLYKRSLALPEVLRKKGYETAAFHSNPYLSRFFHYSKGFDVFEDDMGKVDWFVELRKRMIKMGRRFPARMVRLLARTNIANSPTIKAEELTRSAAAWARGRTRNFFLWVHYMDVHSPRIPPPKYLSGFASGPIDFYDIPNLYNKARNTPDDLSASERRRIVDLYDASIRYVDDNIRMLCTKLSDKTKDNIVVVTSDHGEALGEHGVYGHSDILYEYIVRVPLIMVGLGIQEETIIGRQVSLMGIAPTILEVLGLDVPHDFQGGSLISPAENKETSEGTISVTINNRPQRRAVSYRTEECKFILTENLNDEKVVKEELYDLKKDPEESVNLRRVEPRTAELFLSRIKKTCTTGTANDLAVTDEKITTSEKEKLKEKLRALGYFPE